MAEERASVKLHLLRRVCSQVPLDGHGSKPHCHAQGSPVEVICRVMNGHRLETKAVRLVGDPHHQCTAVLPVGASRLRGCRSLGATHFFAVFRINGVCILVQVGICHLCKMKMVGRDLSGNRVVPFGQCVLLCSFLPSAPFSAIIVLRPVKLARRRAHAFLCFSFWRAFLIQIQVMATSWPSFIKRKVKEGRDLTYIFLHIVFIEYDSNGIANAPNAGTILFDWHMCAGNGSRRLREHAGADTAMRGWTAQLPKCWRGRLAGQRTGGG